MDIVPSRYNFPLAVDGSNYVFSAATGKLAVVKDAATWRFLQGRGRDGLSHSLAEKLLQDGFAALSGADEVGQLMSRRFEQQGRSPLEISVMPTDACGLGCDECNHPSAACGGNSMAPDVEGALASYLKEANRDIHVNWIGGEPLIASDAIEGLTRKLRSVARDNGNKYSSSMVVSGRGMRADETIAGLASRLSVRSFTIAVDGPRAKGDPSAAADADGSVRRIVDMARALQSTGAEVTVGVWYRALPPDRIRSLRDALVEERIDVGFSLKAKHACRPNCIVSSAVGVPVSFIGERCVFRIDCAVSDLVPQPGRLNKCIYSNRFALAVDWRGLVYKCLEDVGIEGRAVCSVTELPGRKSRFISMGDYPFRDKECRECRALPICMGGCHAISHFADRCVWGSETIERLVRAYCSLGNPACDYEYGA